MIRACIFDIGNVLCFFSHEKMFQQMAEVCGVSEETMREQILGNGLGINYEKGLISSDEVYEHFKNGKDGSQVDRYKLFLSMSDIFDPHHAIEPLIQELKERGIRLVLLSNTCEAHFDFLQERFPLFQHFDAAILSYRIGLRKPDEQIFTAAVKISGCEVHECFYTDDIEEYVLAARKFGIDACLFRDAEALRIQLQERGVIG